MKIGDKVHTKYADAYPGEKGYVVDIRQNPGGGPVLHVSFEGSSLAYGFPRWELVYANDVA